MPAFFRKEIINKKAATITIPFHINPRALKPIFVTVFPKNNIRIKAPMARAIFWYLFIYALLSLFDMHLSNLRIRLKVPITLGRERLFFSGTVDNAFF